MQIALTDRESHLLEVLWAHGPSTVAEVQSKLEDELAYTTVLTILRVLESKGYVGHDEEGKAHRYKALIERDAARKSALRHLSSKFFDGSLELLLTHAVSHEKLSAEQITRMRKLLDQAQKRAKK